MATLTLHDVPDAVVARLEERARAHGRSLNHEVLAALECIAADPSPVEPPVPLPEDALHSIRATMARFPGSAQAAQQPRDPGEVRAELDVLARLRSQFKGPPLTSEEIIAAIGRDSHPPELDRFGYRINPES
ncbi:arc-like DNA binding domain protein [Synechococcus sp. RS9909]|uniref:FitA-like ribbon-helix-helix domain-containing protein n=1 Tax=unclassified Synechococcus TaxID=2626047 RepID=UPI000068F755|nr:MULTISPECIES: Arc family DNA-binding protein [unclassified Synechococcus]EAQ69422.1 hypothetical protein RS9917_13300 [Synechococcus sp. RS9917]QNI79322.1 arc-like DNA binding domain protein [Synechococcus sp. RS9909]